MNNAKQRLGNSNQVKNKFLKKFLGLVAATGLTLAMVFFSIQENQKVASQAFTNVANNRSGNAGKDLAISNSKDGGFAVGDINMDGYPDLAVNTYDNGTGTRILISSPNNGNNPRYFDRTNNYCKHCRNTHTERSAMLADINHDGYPDLIRTGNDIIFIYLNQGPANSYHLGVGNNGNPNKTIQARDFHDNRMNTEGVMLADYDNDGWLDIIVENHNYGIDIFANPKDGTANFTCLDPSSTLLPSSATDGDYSAVADVDNDGDIDLVCRKRGARDYFLNNGNGTFNSGVDLDNANNSNKGGVSLADFNNDGLLDLYWTDQGENQIYLNDGNANLIPTQGGIRDGEPWFSAGISAPSSGIDGCATGDVNNDGKVDLFLTDDSGAGYLFINNTPNGGSLRFSRDNLGININGNAEGCSFFDYDRDGDLDLYVNLRNGANQLWRNSLNDSNYVYVEPRIDLGGGRWRSALGASVRLEDCQGIIKAGPRSVTTTEGHGTDGEDLIHFGLEGGAYEVYNVVVDFLAQNGTRKQLNTSFEPSDLDGHRLVIYDTDNDSTFGCDVILPVEWVSFSVNQVDEYAKLTWLVGQETDLSHFEVERSLDGDNFKPLGQVAARGHSDRRQSYNFEDRETDILQSQAVYYRIKQLDIDGQFDYSNVIAFTAKMEDPTFSIKLYPNPSNSDVTLEFVGNVQQAKKVEVFNLNGQSIWKNSTTASSISLPSKEWKAGRYMVQVSTRGSRESRQLVIR